MYTSDGISPGPVRLRSSEFEGGGDCRPKYDVVSLTLRKPEPPPKFDIVSPPVHVTFAYAPYRATNLNFDAAAAPLSERGLHFCVVRTHAAVQRSFG